MLVDEANQFIGETANTIFEKENTSRFEHLTIEDNLLKIPNFANHETRLYSVVE